MSKDDFRRSYYRRTVCEVTREIHDLLQSVHALIGNELYMKFFALLNEQMRMQKKMDLRLKQYKDEYETAYKPLPDWKDRERRRADGMQG